MELLYMQACQKFLMPSKKCKAGKEDSDESVYYPSSRHASLVPNGDTLALSEWAQSHENGMNAESLSIDFGKNCEPSYSCNVPCALGTGKENDLPLYMDLSERPQISSAVMERLSIQFKAGCFGGRVATLFGADDTVLFRAHSKSTLFGSRFRVFSDPSETNEDV